jgi:hypothetical protein
MALALALTFWLLVYSRVKAGAGAASNTFTEFEQEPQKKNYMAPRHYYSCTPLR